MEFSLHNWTTAPADSRAALKRVGEELGYVPALLAQMAESPPVLEAYGTLSAIFRRSSLTPIEQQIVLLAVSVENASHYCTPAHAIRARAASLDEAAVTAIRRGRPLPDARQEALRRLTVQMVRKHGTVSESELDAFVTAGFTRANILEIILAVGLKTLSNYVAFVAKTPLDPPMVAEAFAAGRPCA
ncbi:putative peroxidase-related enzyme [Caulobacter ginsengisoli]|uniref:Peroxidase-related enzyme n=1 Tax=Caulobacter ginsengisoli TaxID=400775 RepID=A0ABU0IS93_9CAUL|nr:carboxymuconolactone decarboxylase family protein [Caulobacter ginsengisoli]MDQ0463889.1 putative peroxidase-related enzyme [Caulobacter ginsengisoli]